MLLQRRGEITLWTSTTRSSVSFFPSNFAAVQADSTRKISNDTRVLSTSRERTKKSKKGERGTRGARLLQLRGIAITCLLNYERLYTFLAFAPKNLCNPINRRISMKRSSLPTRTSSPCSFFFFPFRFSLSRVKIHALLSD